MVVPVNIIQHYELHWDCAEGGPSEHYSTLELHGDCVGGGPSEHYSTLELWGLCWWWSQ